MENYVSRMEILSKIKVVNEGLQKEDDRKVNLIKSSEEKRSQLFSALMDKVRLKTK